MNRRLLLVGLLLSPVTLMACITRTLEMPAAELVPSAVGQIVEVTTVEDRRASPMLGKVDSATIESGPNLITYIQDALSNSLSQMGLSVRHVDRDAPVAGHKRILPSLVTAEISSESSLMYPVAAAVRLRIEVIDESGRSAFQQEARGAMSRELGFHRQGGPEDGRLLADTIDQALSNLAANRSFAAAIKAATPNEQDVSNPNAKAGTSEQVTADSAGTPVPESLAERLATLDKLLEQGLINQEDYDRKRQEILDDL
jgi:hypothetical protein